MKPSESQEQKADELRALDWTRQPHNPEHVIKMVSPTGRLACYISEHAHDYIELERSRT